MRPNLFMKHALLGMGAMALLLPQNSRQNDLFIGAILTATSVAITARVFGDLGQSQRIEAKIILGAAVIDDVLGLLVLAVVSAVAADWHRRVARYGPTVAASSRRRLAA